VKGSLLYYIYSLDYHWNGESNAVNINEKHTFQVSVLPSLTRDLFPTTVCLTETKIHLVANLDLGSSCWTVAEIPPWQALPGP
jgi:hypothetical protein